MPWSALPEHLNSPEKWGGTDHDTKWTRWVLHLKGLMAWGPRAKQWWAKWREYPKTLLAFRSNQGVFRLESEGWERDSSKEYKLRDRLFINHSFDGKYLSRVQLYTRWSFQIQWPFLVIFHRFNKPEDVPSFGTKLPSGALDGKLWLIYFGAQRNADKFYMFPAAYIGRNTK